MRQARPRTQGSRDFEASDDRAEPTELTSDGTSGPRTRRTVVEGGWTGETWSSSSASSNTKN